MPAICVSESSSNMQVDSSIVMHNPSSKYPFLAQDMTESEYRDKFATFLHDLDVNRAEKLSEGAFGIALRCKKIGTGETYILKKIKSDSLGSTKERRDARDQLKAECRLTVELSLKTPYVIQGLGWIPQHGMLLEHATLGSMRQLMSIRQRPLPVQVVFHMVLTLIKGLASVHDAGYLHLDIKPANIFVHGDGRIVIGDFGLSAPMNSRRPGVAGSPRFMSRRQLKPDVTLTREMDWYAVAAMMVEFLDDGCTMFANVTKEDPVWSAGNVVNTVTSLHLRNKYHTPQILHEFEGGLVLLEALRDGTMDPLKLLNSAPLTYGSHEVFLNWALGRRTPRFIPPVANAIVTPVTPTHVHASSSRSPTARRVQAVKAYSPYHRTTPRHSNSDKPVTTLVNRSSPQPSLVPAAMECSPLTSVVSQLNLPFEINLRISDRLRNRQSIVPIPARDVPQPASLNVMSVGATSASASSQAKTPKNLRHPSQNNLDAFSPYDPKIEGMVEGNVPLPPTNSMDISHANADAMETASGDIVRKLRPRVRSASLTGNTAINTPSPAISIVNVTRSFSALKSNHQVEEPVARINEVYVEIPKLTPVTNNVGTHTSPNEKNGLYSQVPPTIAGLASEAAKYNSHTGKQDAAHAKIVQEYEHRGKSDVYGTDLHDHLYHGHQIKMVPLPMRRPSTLMGRLARVWRRLNGPPTNPSTPFLLSNNKNVEDHEQQYTAVSIGSSYLDGSYVSFGRVQPVPSRPVLASPFSDANHAPVYPPRQRRVSVVIDRQH